ncbi:hypothetical protein CR513_26626, partial [Mucuna pruriens]
MAKKQSKSGINGLPLAYLEERMKCYPFTPPRRICRLGFNRHLSSQPRTSKKSSDSRHSRSPRPVETDSKPKPELNSKPASTLNLRN